MFMAATLRKEHLFIMGGEVLADVSGEEPGRRLHLDDSSLAETAWSGRGQ